MLMSAVFCGGAVKLMKGVVHFALLSIAVGHLEAVSWRVDYTLSSSELREVDEPVIQLKLQAKGAESGSTETTVVSVSSDKFRVLLTGEFCILSNHNFSSNQLARIML